MYVIEAGFGICKKCLSSQGYGREGLPKDKIIRLRGGKTIKYYSG